MRTHGVAAVFVRVIGLFPVCLFLLTASGGIAGVPERISYQGRLTDLTGNPLSGDHDAMFVIYDDALEGVVIWSETKTITADADGVFSTILGSVTPLDCSFAEPRWLEVYIDGMGLAPRREIVSVASALDARNAANATTAASADNAAQAGNADSLGHAPAASYSPVGHVHDDTYPLRFELTNPGTINLPSNPVDWSKLKNVPPGFADGTDAEGAGAGDGHSLDAADGSPTDAVYVNDAGRVGVGTQDPEVPLHIYTGSAGAITAEGTVIDLMVEDDYGAIIGLLDRQVGGLYFGDTDAVNAGYITYHHDTDEMRFGAGFATRLTILSDGKLGIGTPSPGRNLHIKQDANSAVGIRIENNSTGPGSAESIEFTDETGTNAGIFMYDDGATQANDLQIFNERSEGAILLSTSTADNLVVGSDGMVGIGTQMPESPLHVYSGSAGAVTAGSDMDIVVEDNGNALISLLSPPASYQGLYFGDPDANRAGWIMYNHEEDQLLLAANGTNRISISSDGKVGISTNQPLSDLELRRDADRMVELMITNNNTGAASGEAIVFADESGANVGIRATDNDEPAIPNHLAVYNNEPGGKISLHTNNLERLTVATNGNVGVGAISPGYKLDVAGTVNLNKDIISGVALRVNGAEALWYNDTYFSWGFGGASNYFADEVGVGTTAPTAKLDISGTNGYDQVRMRTSFTPTGSADARGNVGDVAWDNNYVYVKTGSGWKRTSLSSW